MANEKSPFFGNTTMIILKLLEEKDMYGYQIVEEITIKTNNAFNLKTGSLYPILHALEKDGMVTSYDENADSLRVRKYYRLTDKGRNLLLTKESEWKSYVSAVNRIMDWGDEHAPA